MTRTEFFEILLAPAAVAICEHGYVWPCGDPPPKALKKMRTKVQRCLVREAARSAVLLPRVIHEEAKSVALQAGHRRQLSFKRPLCPGFEKINGESIGSYQVLTTIDQNFPPAKAARAPAPKAKCAKSKSAGGWVAPKKQRTSTATKTLAELDELEKNFFVKSEPESSEPESDID
jgi:hypothetical protein